MPSTVRYAILAMVGLYALEDRALPATVTPGNLLAAYGNRIYEVSTAGIVLQSFHVPQIDRYFLRTLGDIVYDPAGVIHVRINSVETDPCCSSLISSFDLASETWIDTRVLNYNAGLLALELTKLGHTLYTEKNQFDLLSRHSFDVSPVIHSEPDRRVRSLTAGRDGFLYAAPETSPADHIFRIDPVSYEQVDFPLTTANPLGERLHILGIAVQPDGDYYVADGAGRVFGFKRDSTYVAQSESFGVAAADLSLSEKGWLAFGQTEVGNSDGTLVILDEQLDVRAKVTLQSSFILHAM